MEGLAIRLASIIMHSYIALVGFGILAKSCIAIFGTAGYRIEEKGSMWLCRAFACMVKQLPYNYCSLVAVNFHGRTRI